MTSVAVKSGLARHGRALVSILLFQTLLILWLSVWAIEDYLNNQYVRAYVDGAFQAEGWMLGLVAFVGVLGSVMGLVIHRKHGAKSLEIEVGSGSKTSLGSPGLGMKKMTFTGAPITAARSIASAPILVASQSTSPSPSQSVELHPAVAALKAELSEARMSLGLAAVTPSPQMPTGPATNFDDKKPTLQVQSPPQPRSPMVPPRPQLSVGNQIPPTVIRPSSSQSFRPVPATVIRPMAPPTPTGAAPFTQGAPIHRVEPSTPPASAPQSIPASTRTEIVPVSKDSPTVITGVVPSQQEKKKEAETQNGKNTAQQ